MSTIWKTVLGIFLAIVTLFVCLGVIGATNDAAAADAYMHKCSAEMQVCDFNQTVVDELIAEATENGYTMTVAIKKDAYGDVLYATIELEYAFRIPVIGLESYHTKSMIAK